jgi:predicted transcriptional regulator
MQKNNTKEQQAEKAARILELNIELRDLQSKRKSVAGAFTTRIKEVKQDIQDILNDEDTAKEIVAGVHDIHDLKLVE